jgi:hypothetical protein
MALNILLSSLKKHLFLFFGRFFEEITREAKLFEDEVLFCEQKIDEKELR